MKATPLLSQPKKIVPGFWEKEKNKNTLFFLYGHQAEILPKIKNKLRILSSFSFDSKHTN